MEGLENDIHKLKRFFGRQSLKSGLFHAASPLKVSPRGFLKGSVPLNMWSQRGTPPRCLEIIRFIYPRNGCISLAKQYIVRLPQVKQPPPPHTHTKQHQISDLHVVYVLMALSCQPVYLVMPLFDMVFGPPSPSPLTGG